MTISYLAIAPFIPSISGKIYIAYSGGIDSHVLLHLCASQTDLRTKIVAVYVNHGLQTEAKAWGVHCRSQSEKLAVPFINIGVNAHPKNGESPEAAAREARYRALQDLLKPNDSVLLAQHREDQMETLLLQLFRGAGIQGLAAMPIATSFGQGHMLRPLLDIAKADIQEYANIHQLEWIEDPSNQSPDFDRNYLRNTILPLLRQRWPSIDKTVARSARHCSEALELLETWGDSYAQALFDPLEKTLHLEKLTSSTDTEINWALRQWFRALALKPPSEAMLNNLKAQLLHARPDSYPMIQSQGCVFTRFRQTLFCLPQSHAQPFDNTCRWPSTANTIVCSNGSLVTRIEASPGIAQTLWHASKITLRPRSGGEKIKLPGRNGQHSLKNLFQEAGIPPWARNTRPLIFLDDKLAAVAGLWVADWAYSDNVDACFHVTWQFPENMP